MILFVVLLSTSVYAAVVSHTAEQIRSGSFGQTHTGDFSFVNGSIAINTTSPTSTLDVDGTVKADYFVGDGSQLTGIGGSSAGMFVNESGDAVFTTGNVGIGRASPESALDIYKLREWDGSTQYTFINHSLLIKGNNSGGSGSTRGIKIRIDSDRINNGSLSQTFVTGLDLTLDNTANDTSFYAMDVRSENYGNSATQNNAIRGFANSRHTAGSATEAVGVTGQARHFSTGDTTSVVGVSGEARSTGAGSITSLYGVRGRVYYPSSGTITDAASVVADYDQSGGTITNAYGLYVPNMARSGGTATNAYGIYVGTAGIGTNSYPIYVADTGTSHFAGNLTLGGNLNVSGATYFGTQAFTNIDASGNLVVGKNLTVNSNDFFVNSESGYVGIGTNNPTASLHINQGGAANTVALRIHDIDNDAISAAINITDEENNPYFLVQSAGIGANDVGKIGIGTKRPGAHVHIRDGGIAGYTSLLIDDVDNEAVSYAINVTDENGNPYFLIQTTGGGDDDTGRIGIGTSSPNSMLTLAGNFTPSLNNTYSLGTSELWWKDLYVGTGTIYIGGRALEVSQDGDLQWNGSSISEVRSVGNITYFAEEAEEQIGVGTAEPTAKLDVQGNVSLNNTFYVAHNKRVGIGTDTPAHTLHVVKDKGTLDALSSYVTGVFQNNDGGTDQSGIAVIAGDVGISKIFMGDTSDSDVGEIRYDHAYNRMGFTVNTASNVVLIDGSGNVNATGDVCTTGGNCLSAVSGSSNNWNISASNVYPADPNWQVGIGTTDPDQALHVHSDSTTLQYISTDGDTDVKLFFSTDYDNDGGGKQWAGMVFDDSEDSFKIINSADSNDNHLTISNVGNVGIGTSSPDEELHVVGSDNTGAILIENNATKYGLYSTDTISGNGFGIYDFQSSTYRLAIENDTGYVGIGTTSPSAILTVKSTGDNGNIRLEDSDSTQRLFQVKQNGAASGDGVLTLYDGGENPDIQLNPGGDSYFMGSGDIGIGTTTPGAPLDVNGSYNQFYIRSTSGNPATFSNYLGQDLRILSTTSGQRNFTLSSDASMGEAYSIKITDDGKIGVGTLSPKAKLDVAGAINATGDICTTGGTCLSTVGAGAGGWTDDGSVVRLTTSSDNVGIGTSTPDATLEIRETGSDANALKVSSSYDNMNTIFNGTGHSQMQIMRGSSSKYGDISFMTQSQINWVMGVPDSDGQTWGAAGSEFYISQAGVNDPKFVIETDGKVGIGAPSPGYLLHINQTSSSPVNMAIQNPSSGNNAYAGIQIVSDQASGALSTQSSTYDNSGFTYLANRTSLANTHAGLAIRASGSAGDILFATGGQSAAYERMRIDSSGNVGIGTASPGERFVVKSPGTSSAVVQHLSSDNQVLMQLFEDASTNGIFSVYGTGNNVRVMLNSAGNSYFTGGNVGIGTTTPGAKLDVAGAINATGDICTVGGPCLSTVSSSGGGWTDDGAYVRLTTTTDNVIIGGTTGGYPLTVSADPESSDEANVGFITSTTYANANENRTGIRIAKKRTGTWANTYLYIENEDTSSNPDTVFTIAPTNGSGNAIDVMSVVGDGNVGIGTTDPGAKLELSELDTHNDIAFEISNSTGDRLLMINNERTSAAAFNMYENGVNTIRLDSNTEWPSFFNAGKVGIGTTSPEAPLELRSDIFPQMIMNGTDNSGNIGIQFWGAANRGEIKWNSGNNNLDFSGEGGTVDMVIDHTGDVGIGTTSPTQKLHVEGNANVTENIYYGGNLTGYGADFAELMTKAGDVEAGDVVCLNEDMHVSKCTEKAQPSVAGVVSTKPTIIGNAAAENAVPVAIVGIVPTKVKGPVAAYDMLTTSENGFAEKATIEDFGAIIGKAMGPCETECTIKVLVGLR